MRLLADENFPLAAVEALRVAGHDIAYVRMDSPGISDDEVLQRSLREERVLLTFDKDFGEIVFLRGGGASCGVVLFRVLRASPEETVRFIVDSLSSREDWRGSFSVVDSRRVRMRRLPDGRRI